MIIGVLLLWLTFRGQFTLSQFLNSFRLPALLIGSLFTIFGLVLYLSLIHI